MGPAARAKPTTPRLPALIPSRLPVGRPVIETLGRDGTWVKPTTRPQALAGWIEALGRQTMMTPVNVVDIRHRGGPLSPAGSAEADLGSVLAGKPPIR